MKYFLSAIGMAMCMVSLSAASQDMAKGRDVNVILINSNEEVTTLSQLQLLKEWKDLRENQRIDMENEAKQNDENNAKAAKQCKENLLKDDQYDIGECEFKRSDAFFNRIRALQKRVQDMARANQLTQSINY